MWHNVQFLFSNFQDNSPYLSTRVEITLYNIPDCHVFANAFMIIKYICRCESQYLTCTSFCLLFLEGKRMEEC